MVRSEGLEPPRFYSLPPQGSASTSSATSALGKCRLWAPDQRRRCNKRIGGGQGLMEAWTQGFPVAFWVIYRAGYLVLYLVLYLVPGDFGSICLTSTAMRLRSTSTTPEATGRLLARTLTSSASVASNSM